MSSIMSDCSLSCISNEKDKKKEDVELSLKLENFKIFDLESNNSAKIKKMSTQATLLNVDKSSSPLDEKINSKTIIKAIPQIKISPMIKLDQNYCSFYKNKIHHFPQPYLNMYGYIPYQPTVTYGNINVSNPMLIAGTPLTHFNNFPTNMNYPFYQQNIINQQILRLQQNIFFVSQSLLMNFGEKIMNFGEILQRFTENTTDFLLNKEGNAIYNKLILRINSQQKIELWERMAEKLLIICSNDILINSLIKLLKLMTEKSEQKKVVSHILTLMSKLLETEKGTKLVLFILENYCIEIICKLSSYIISNLKYLLSKENGLDIVKSYVMINVNNSITLKTDFINSLFPYLINIVNDERSRVILKIIKHWNLPLSNRLYDFLSDNMMILINGKVSCLIIKWIIENMEDKVSKTLFI